MGLAAYAINNQTMEVFMTTPQDGTATPQDGTATGPKKPKRKVKSHNVIHSKKPSTLVKWLKRGGLFSAGVLTVLGLSHYLNRSNNAEANA
jgi:hypothetical protein